MAKISLPMFMKDVLIPVTRIAILNVNIIKITSDTKYLPAYTVKFDRIDRPGKCLLLFTIKKVLRYSSKYYSQTVGGWIAFLTDIVKTIQSFQIL